MYEGFVVGVKVKCHANLIFIGDIMHSVTLLKYNSHPPALLEVFPRPVVTMWLAIVGCAQLWWWLDIGIWATKRWVLDCCGYTWGLGCVRAEAWCFWWRYKPIPKGESASWWCGHLFYRRAVDDSRKLVEWERCKSHYASILWMRFEQSLFYHISQIVPCRFLGPWVASCLWMTSYWSCSNVWALSFWVVM